MSRCGMLCSRVDVCLTSETTTVFQNRKWSTFNIQYYKSSSYSTFLIFFMSLTPFPSFPNTKMFGTFDFSHSGGYIIIFHYNTMANNVIIGHLLIFSFELSVQVFFLLCVCVLFLIKAMFYFRSSILWNSASFEFIHFGIMIIIIQCSSGLLPIFVSIGCLFLLLVC